MSWNSGSRSNRRRSRALVLRRIPYGETSLILTLFTRDNGRLAVMAKGAHRPKGPYWGRLELLTEIEAAWSERATREIQTLTGVTVLEPRRTLPGRLSCYLASLAVSEVLGHATHDHLAVPAFYDLSADVLRCLEQTDTRPAPVYLAFLLGTLDHLGLRPVLEACAVCGGGLGDHPRMDPPAGGAVCAPCAGPDARATLPGVLEVAGRIRRAGPHEVRRWALDPDLGHALRGTVETFFDWHLERRPRSRTMLESHAWNES